MPFRRPYLMSRRDMLRVGGTSFFGLTLPHLFQAQASPSSNGAGGGKAKQLLIVWMQGGPPQIDMFDMKPNSRKAAVRK